MGPGERPHIRDHDIEILRRSLVSSGLPTESVAWLLDETRRLLAERAEIGAALAQLSGPWADVRSVLNDLNRLTQPDQGT